MHLYKREIFDKIKPYLGDETILVLLGARQVGKTHVLYFIEEYLKQNGHKTIYYDLEFPNLLETLNLGVDSFIADLTNKGYVEGKDVFVFIDEIQYLENPSSFLKIIADHYKNIHLIVSGSSTFDIKTKFTNSLAGRTLYFEIFPLSFREYLIFRNSKYINIDNLPTSQIDEVKNLYYEFIKFGGYPKIALEPDGEKKKLHLIQLIDTYIRKDIRDLADITDVNKFNQMLKVLASQSGQLLNVSALSRETNISEITLHKYLSILEETFVIKRLTPFSNSPSVEISKNPKVFFYDSGLLSILWLNNFQDTVIGSIFETNIFGELIKKFGKNNIHFWRTKIGQEIDFIIKGDNLNITPIEVKTSFGQFNQKAIRTFGDKYKFQNWNIIGISGEKKGKEFLYPWEI